MRILTKALILFFLHTPLVSQAYEISVLQMTPQQVLEIVLTKMNLTLNPTVPLFSLHLQSQTELGFMQDSVEEQWGFRPDVFTNVFAYKTNRIFILDDAKYYKRNNRFIDDSLAHEIVHYVQVYYQNADLEDFSLESEAIDIQTWFRDTYMINK